jgi:aspartate carbamoyltransferase catalytic subunit
MSFINAGEGSISHPTQALLDIKTIIDHKESLDNLKIVIVGDLDHSRVTSSFVEGISNFEIGSLIFCGHPEMCTKYQNPKLGSYEADMNKALEDADVVMTLRIQHERFENELNLDLETYKSLYQLSSEKLESAKGDAIIMHPGPVNYIEITEAVYDSENSVIRQQIANGVAIRMAVLSRFLGS